MEETNTLPPRPQADLSCNECAEILGIHRTEVLRLIRSGVLRAWVLNPAARRKTYRIPAEALNELRERQAVQSPPLKGPPKQPESLPGQLELF